MNYQPKVSIITVCFNSVKTIRDTIESVINQTYKNIEYIIIDGGSTDGTVDIIREYEPYIAKWVCEPDNGIYDAMNKGIRMSTGEIIGIINSDDWYALDCISSVVHTFTSESKPDIVHGNIVICDEEGALLYCIKGKNDIKKEIFKRMTVFHPTMFVKKEVYENERLYNSNYVIAGDYDFLFNIIRGNYLVEYLDKELAFMRLGGISNKKYFKSAMECFTIRLNNRQKLLFNIFITLKNIVSPMTRKALVGIGLSNLVILFRTKHYDIKFLQKSKYLNSK